MTTKLVLLGTGSPACRPEAFQSSAVVVAGERPFLIDCGGGTVQRLSMAQANGVAQLAWPNLQHLIITHLHPDHTVGLVDLIISTWVRGRSEPLKIYGPAGTAKMVRLLIEAYEIGIEEHLRHDDFIDRQLQYQVIEYKAGRLIEDDDVTIEAFKVSHGELETYGLKFVTTDKTIVFSADTKPHPSVVAQATDCDILVHEAYSELGLKHATWYPESYFLEMHTSTKELAEIARATRPKKLIITHKMHLQPDISDADFLREITDLYDGEVVMGQDLDIFS